MTTSRTMAQLIVMLRMSLDNFIFAPMTPVTSTVQPVPPSAPTQNRMRRWAALAMASLLVTEVFVTTIDKTVREISWFQATAGIDDAIQLVQRFAPLKDLLAPCQTFGYATDMDPADEESFYKEFIMLRYITAPGLPILELDQALVIGNFYDPQSRADILAAHKLTLVYDFGNGVLLLERKERRP
ncbi:hypothetical protein DSUL_20051 [Desulfovibrionales bacterium]